jgi:hypothetical protein
MAVCRCPITLNALRRQAQVVPEVDNVAYQLSLCSIATQTEVRARCRSRRLMPLPVMKPPRAARRASAALRKYRPTEPAVLVALAPTRSGILWLQRRRRRKPTRPTSRARGRAAHRELTTTRRLLPAHGQEVASTAPATAPDLDARPADQGTRARLEALISRKPGRRAAFSNACLRLATFSEVSRSRRDRIRRSGDCQENQPRVMERPPFRPDRRHSMRA